MDRAFQLKHHAIQYGTEFFILLKDAFKKSNYGFTGDIKNNMVSISKKIRTYGIYNITDMLRATIYVDSMD